MKDGKLNNGIFIYRTLNIGKKDKYKIKQLKVAGNCIRVWS